MSSASSARVIVIGATNRPQELDEAARRRFTKRLYIPLPDAKARRTLITGLLKKNSNTLSLDDIESLVVRSKGYSGADVHNLCSEAAMGPIRDIASIGKGIISQIQNTHTYIYIYISTDCVQYIYNNLL